MQQIQVLTENNFLEIQKFYWKLIDKMHDSVYLPGWKKGVYPSNEFLMESLTAGELFAMKIDENIVAAMILNHDCNEGYKEAQWNVNADADEIMVIHSLGVSPEYHGHGFAKKMVEEAINIATQKQQKAIRLDVLNGNLPALKLYEKIGFQYCKTVQMFYEDTGWTDYLLYELVL